MISTPTPVHENSNLNPRLEVTIPYVQGTIVTQHDSHGSTWSTVVLTTVFTTIRGIPSPPSSSILPPQSGAQITPSVVASNSHASQHVNIIVPAVLAGLFAISTVLLATCYFLRRRNKRKHSSDRPPGISANGTSISHHSSSQRELLSGSPMMAHQLSSGSEPRMRRGLHFHLFQPPGQRTLLDPIPYTESRRGGYPNQNPKTFTTSDHQLINSTGIGSMGTQPHRRDGTISTGSDVDSPPSYHTISSGAVRVMATLTSKDTPHSPTHNTS